MSTHDKSYIVTTKKITLFLLLSTFITYKSYSNSASTQILPRDLLTYTITQAQTDSLESMMLPDVRKAKKPNNKYIHRQPEKDWTFLVYIAADNDLNYFAWKNIRQMEKIGSNKHLNIVIQLSERGKRKPTQRLIVQRGKHDKINLGNKKLDSGSPHTLINFCTWAFKTFPAKNYALILWNHGTGALEPSRAKSINPSELFIFNPSNSMLELDRSVGFFDFINSYNNPLEGQRGICFDESHRSFITNDKLGYALSKICQDGLEGKKLKIIGFDACLMSMIEVAHVTKNYAEIMVGSQEVELGSGWNYQKALAPFTQNTITPAQLASNIVSAYKASYGNIVSDFTQSAIDLTKAELLEQNINAVSLLLQKCLSLQSKATAKNTIKMCRSRRLCTCFDEPTYIDLYDFYENICKNINNIHLTDKENEKAVLASLEKALTDGKNIIQNTVLANTVGPNLARAKGISIYFPLRGMHRSYTKNSFASQNNWYKFLQQYLRS